MNLLLLEPEEADGRTVRLRGRRAEHVRRVLRVAAGSTLQAGILGQSRGNATVLSVSPKEVLLTYEAQHPVAVGRGRTLLLAVPRPKVLSRCLQHAAALGYERIALFRSSRVEKSHFDSHKLSTADMRCQLVLGLEQSRRVRLPKLSLHTRFRPFVEDELPEILPRLPRYVAHPDTQPTRLLVEKTNPDFVLAVGPEGGFVPFELELLQAHGFKALSVGTSPLRVESALSCVTGYLIAAHNLCV